MKTLRITLLAVVALMAQFAHAQNSQHIYVAEGGNFSNPEFPPIFKVYEDGFDADPIYTDTIDDVSSFQDVEFAVGVGAFLCAENRIILYPNQNDYSEQEVFDFPNVRKVNYLNGALFAGRYFGEGDYLFAFDVETGDTLYTSENITQPYESAISINDSLVAVAYNFPSSEDACAPYGCFSDSLGKVELINTKTWESSTLDLREGFTGELQFVTWTNGFVLVSDDAEEVIFYDDELMELFVFENSGIKSIAEDNLNGVSVQAVAGDEFESSYYFLAVDTADYLSEIQVSLVSQSVVSITPLKDVSGKSVLPYFSDFLFIETDYSTSSTVTYFNFDEESDYQFGPSVEDVAFGDVITGLADWNFVENQAVGTYLYSDLGQLSFLDFVLVDATGKNYGYYSDLSQVSFDAMAHGVYLLKNIQGEEVRVIKD